jgi:hypothetical protein
MGTFASAGAHAAQPHAAMHMAASMPRQVQMLASAAPGTSLPPGMMMHPGMHPVQMHVPAQQVQQQQQQQQPQGAAVTSQRRESAPQVAPHSMPPGSHDAGFPMQQQMNMMDDPLMTTLH